MTAVSGPGLRSIQALRAHLAGYQRGGRRLDSDDTTLMDDFPGLEYAPEYRDVVEAAQRQRGQLQNLVQLCRFEIERRGLAPDDEELRKELLRRRFDALRAVDAEAAAVTRRLKTKQEDIVRRREDELEQVLGSIQNICVTHPKEMRHLMMSARPTDTLTRALGASTVDPWRVHGIVERPASAAAGAFVTSSTALSPLRPASSTFDRSLTPGPVKLTPQTVMDLEPEFAVGASTATLHAATSKRAASAKNNSRGHVQGLPLQLAPRGSKARGSK
jgi:hypothetical protein